jgi:hypothetical protein
MKIMSQELKFFCPGNLEAFPELTHDEALACTGVEEPKNKHGDYACSAAFKLSKRFNKNPRTVADKIIEHFPKDYRVASLEFAAPGFINLRLSDEYLARHSNNLKQVLVWNKASTRPAGDCGVLRHQCGQAHGRTPYFVHGDWRCARKYFCFYGE